MKKFKIPKNCFAAVLCYHRIGSHLGIEPINEGLKISESNFEKTIKWFMKNNYNFISLDELYEYITKKTKLKTNKNIVLTFDDGYKDNLYALLPICRKYNVPFAVYVATNALGGVKDYLLGGIH